MNIEKKMLKKRIKKHQENLNKKRKDGFKKSIVKEKKDEQVIL